MANILTIQEVRRLASACDTENWQPEGSEVMKEYIQNEMEPTEMLYIIAWLLHNNNNQG